MEDGRQSWDDFIKESCDYPEGLSGIENRLKKRVATAHKTRSALFGSLSAVAAAFLFVLLVNTSTAFAGSISELPLIGSLAEFVKFDKSLSNAIENDYLQEVDLTAWDGQEQLLLPYVIADERNLVLFFQLPKDFESKPNQWLQISLMEMTNGITGEKIEEFCYTSSSLSAEENKKDHGFIQQSYHFSGEELPQSINLKVSVEIEEIEDSYDAQPEEASQEDDLKSNVTTVGTFTFQLVLEEFADPIIYEFHKNYIIENQQIILEEMRVYPTGTEVSFTFPDENTAWIRGLNLAVAQEGKVLLLGKNGLSATGDDQKRSVFIESNYFGKQKDQELLIQGIRLLNKEEEYITVDLENKTITPAISGMKLDSVSKSSEKAFLKFSTKVSDDDCFGMFSFEYRDLAGKTYELRQEGSSVIDSFMETRITVEYPKDGKLIFQRTLTPKQTLEEPIRISLPIQE